MATAWFLMIAGMLAVYVVLDGFDLGAGVVHLWAARTDGERRTILAAIGPVWDGNEVWLLASGGMLVYAFPRVYSAGFSGFYLPLMMTLWLLIMRGCAIEFRSHQTGPLWRSFWDGCFWFSSTLLTVLFGAALGCVIRGVPIEASGFFSGPLFTNFQPGGNPGVLDWYTVTVGLLSLTVLAGHGALYLALKTEGDLEQRARKASVRAYAAAFAIGVLATIGTHVVRPELFAHLGARPITWVLVLGVATGICGLIVSLPKQQFGAAFGFSTCFIVSILAATAVGLFPNLLTSTLNPAYSLTVDNSAAGAFSMRIGFVWWSGALLLATGYYTYLFRSFRGKVGADSHYGH